jgi:hypothetical protein
MATNTLGKLGRTETVLRLTYEKLLYHPVFQGVIGNDHCPATCSQQSCKPLEGSLEGAQFVIYKYAQSLESPGKGFRQQRASDYTSNRFHKLSGGLQLFMSNGMVYSIGDGPCLPFLTEPSYDVGEGIER